MGHILLVVAAANPPPDSSVGPGVGGFLVIFVLALATVVLIRSMIGHLRKVRYGPGPDAKTPDAKTPDAKTPDAKAPEADAPDAKAPEADERSDERSG